MEAKKVTSMTTIHRLRGRKSWICLQTPDSWDPQTPLTSTPLSTSPVHCWKNFHQSFKIFYQRTRKVVSSFTTFERLHFFLFFMICLCTWRDLIQNVALDLMLKYVMNARILFVGLQIAHCTLVSFQGKLESRTTRWMPPKLGGNRSRSESFGQHQCPLSPLAKLEPRSEPSLLCVHCPFLRRSVMIS